MCICSLPHIPIYDIYHEKSSKSMISLTYSSSPHMLILTISIIQASHKIHAPGVAYVDAGISAYFWPGNDRVLGKRKIVCDICDWLLEDDLWHMWQTYHVRNGCDIRDAMMAKIGWDICDGHGMLRNGWDIYDGSWKRSFVSRSVLWREVVRVRHIGKGQAPV